MEEGGMTENRHATPPEEPEDRKTPGEETGRTDGAAPDTGVAETGEAVMQRRRRLGLFIGGGTILLAVLIGLAVWLLPGSDGIPAGPGQASSGTVTGSGSTSPGGTASSNGEASGGVSSGPSSLPPSSSQPEPSPSVPRIVETRYPTEDVVVADLVATDAPYNADPTGQADCAAVIQTALNDCARQGGGTVFLPAGKYLLQSGLRIPAFVTLRGDWQDPDEGTDYGTVLLADVASSDTALPALLDIGGSAGVLGLTVYYPNQTLDDVKPYPFTFYVRGLGDGYMLQSVQNCTVINGYRGLGACVQETTAHEMLTVDTLKGTFLYRGAEAYNQADVGTWKNVSFSGKYWAEAGAGFRRADRTALDAYTRRHAEGLVLGDLEWTEFAGASLDSFKTGIHLVKGKRIQFAGSFTDVTAENCGIALLADDLDPRWGTILARSRLSGSEAAVRNNTNGLVKLAGVILEGAVSGAVSREDASLSAYGAELDRSAPKPKAVLFPVAVADGDKKGKADISDKLQAALDKAGKSGGGVVYLPAGKYRLDAPVTVPAGVELRGCSSVPTREQGGSSLGTLILAYYGRGSVSPESAAALVTLAGKNAGIRGVRFIYPENGIKAGIVSYPYTVRGSAPGVYAVNCAVSGGYYGIDFRGCDGHFIKKFVSCCYQNAIAAGGKGGLIEGCLMNANMLYRDGCRFPGWPTNERDIQAETMNAVTRARCEFLRLEGAQNETVLNTFAYGVKNFLVSKTSAETLLLNIGADNIGSGQPMLDIGGGSLTAVNMMRYNGASYHAGAGAAVRFYNRLTIGQKDEPTVS